MSSNIFYRVWHERDRLSARWANAVQECLRGVRPTTPGLTVQYFPDGSGIGLGIDASAFADALKLTTPHPFTVALQGGQSRAQSYSVTNGRPLSSPVASAGRVHAAAYWGMAGAAYGAGNSLPALMTAGYINWPLAYIEASTRCENLQWGDIVIPAYYTTPGSEGGLQVIEDVWDAGPAVYQRVRNVATGAVADEKLWDWGYCSTTTTTTSTTTSTTTATTTTSTTTATTTEEFPDYWVWLAIAVSPGTAGVTRLAVAETRAGAL